MTTRIVRSFVMVASGGLLLLSSSGASAGNPWQLHCPSMPTERPLPAPLRAEALRFYRWVRPAANGLRAGSVYLVALSTRTTISRDGDELDSAGYLVWTVNDAPRIQRYLADPSVAVVATDDPVLALTERDRQA